MITRTQLLRAGLGPRSIRRRVEAGRLHLIHRGVYAFGTERLNRQGRWLAAVLACGDNATLSHRSAAALWSLIKRDRTAVEVTGERGRRRPGIAVHECGIREDERIIIDRIPVTTVARTLLDLAEVNDLRTLRYAFEEADRRGLLHFPELERVYAHGHGRRALKPLRRLIDADRGPVTLTPLEDRVVALCRAHGIPLPVTNVEVNGREVDALWPEEKLMVEADSFEFHGHRAAFESDRARDAAMQVAGYNVVRLTHRRLTQEPAKVAAELRHLLARRRAGSSRST